LKNYILIIKDNLISFKHAQINSTLFNQW